MSAARGGGSLAGAALAVWLGGWLGWGALAGAGRLARDLAGLEPAELVRAVRAPSDARVRDALNPFGHRLLLALETRTAPDATVHLVTDASPAMLRLWLGLSALLFPRSIVPRTLDAPLSDAVTSVVIARAGDPPPAPRAERLADGSGPPGIAVWLVPARAP